MAILREKLKHAATVGEADSFSQPRELEQKVPSCRARSSAVAHLPDGAIAIFAEKQAAIFGDRDSDRASPDITIGRDKSGDEIFVLTDRFAG